MLPRENASRGFGRLLSMGALSSFPIARHVLQLGQAKLTSEVISPEVSFGDRVELRADILEWES